MEVTAAIDQAEYDLTHTLDELRMAKELVATLEQDAKRIQIELVGLRSYAQRRGLTAVPDLSADVVPISSQVQLAALHKGPDLTVVSRSEAVATIMRQSPGPVDRNTIHEQFVQAGRFDTIDDISLSLSGLKRAGRVDKLGQGLWALVESTPATGN
jgi:hypothetical protein